MEDRTKDEDPDGAADEELVRRVRTGDQAALRELLSRHGELLRSRARRRVRGPLRRKLGESDVLQETYLAAFEGLDRFEDRGPGSFRKWLEGILHHKANDEVKRHLHAGKRSARREESRTSTAPDPAVSGPSPGSQVAHDEELERLSSALETLEGDDRLVLELVYRQGKDFAEAGRAMGRSAEAARKLYGRSVLRLSRQVRRAP